MPVNAAWAELKPSLAEATSLDDAGTTMAMYVSELMAIPASLEKNAPMVVVGSVDGGAMMADT